MGRKELINCDCNGCGGHGAKLDAHGTWEHCTRCDGSGLAADEALLTTIPALEARVAKLEALLRKVEWGGSCMAYGSNCPSCHATAHDVAPYNTHDEGCELAAALMECG
jgi:hypothetical protein